MSFTSKQNISSKNVKREELSTVTCSERQAGEVVSPVQGPSPHRPHLTPPSAVRRSGAAEEQTRLLRLASREGPGAPAVRLAAPGSQHTLRPCSPRHCTFSRAQEDSVAGRGGLAPWVPSCAQKSKGQQSRDTKGKGMQLEVTRITGGRGPRAGHCGVTCVR